MGKSIECTDAVSREAVDEIKELMTDINGDTVYAVRMSDIRQLPSVTQKSGKWIIKEDNTSYVKTIPRRWAECSCCKWSMSPGYVERYAFCPNCGARMESEE